MMAKPYAIEPPRAATWLVSLFTLARETESILGDLLEEFSDLVSSSGAAFARRWYWRQTLKTVVHLVPSAFTVAPWSTAAGVVVGFTARKLLGPLVEPMIFAVLQRYQVYEHHFAAYMFFASTGIDIGHLITFLGVGCIVAWMAKGTEMAATMVLSLFFAALAVVAFVHLIGKTGNLEFAWRLAWNFADVLAIVVGGAIVRISRFNASRVPLQS
jgi:hypothetical protein